MNKFNALHDDEPKDPPRKWNIQPPEAHLKSRTYPSKTNPLISEIMERLNHHAIDNGDVEVHPSEFPVDYHSESVPEPDTTLIKSIDDDEMDHLLELFYSEHDEGLLDVDLHMLQS